MRSGYSSLPTNAGVKQGLIGSLYLMLFVVVLAIPLGVAAAIYLEEYARDTRLTRFINTNIRNLAGVPSIVYGILGSGDLRCQVAQSVTVPVHEVQRARLRAVWHCRALVLPIIIITTLEALGPFRAASAEAGSASGRPDGRRSGAMCCRQRRSQVFLPARCWRSPEPLGETAPILIGRRGDRASSRPGQRNLLEQLAGRFTALPTVIFAVSPDNRSRISKHSPRGHIADPDGVDLRREPRRPSCLRNRYERKW